jgi:hypothetical protein
MAKNTPTFRKTTGSIAMTASYNTIVYDYYPMISIPDRPIYWDARYSLEWASGKVAYEHNNILSSGIGMSVVKILTKRVMGGELQYRPRERTDAAKKSTDKLKYIAENDLNFSLKTQTLISKGLAGGTSYFVLSPDMGELRLDTIGIDQAFCLFKGDKINNAKLFINYIDDNASGIGVGSRYFLIEERYYDKGKPYRVNQIYRSSLPQMQGSTQYFSFEWLEDKKTKANLEGSLDNLPDKIKKELELSEIEIGVKKELPFNDLGIYHFKNETTDLKHPNSKYGQPILSGAYDLLWAYDFAFSVLNRDLQVGRALTFIPTHLNGNQLLAQQMGDRELGNAYYEAKIQFPALFDDAFIKVPNSNSEYQKPETVQFDIRADKLKTSLDTIASMLANHVGISPMYLISNLNYQNETKTATEVASDMSETNLTVSNKRKLLSYPINKALDTIAYFYNLNPNHIEIIFPPLEEMNSNMKADYIVKLRGVGGMSDEMLVDQAYPQLSEGEKQEEVERLKQLRAEKNKVMDEKIKGDDKDDETENSEPDNKRR